MTDNIIWIQTYQQPSFPIVLTSDVFPYFKLNVVSSEATKNTIVQPAHMSVQENSFDEMTELLSQFYQDVDESLLLPLNLTSFTLEDFSNPFTQALDYYLLLDETSFIEKLEFSTPIDIVESVPNDLHDLSYDELLNVVLIEEGSGVPVSNGNPNSSGDVSSISTPINLNSVVSFTVADNLLSVAGLNKNPSDVLLSNIGNAVNAPFTPSITIIFNGSLINTNGPFTLYNNIFQTGENFNFTPVVLDLDGSGINLLSAAQSGVSVAMDNALQYQIGWIGQGSGVLAFDPLLTGEVTSKYQIEFSSYLNGAITDLEGLSIFDTNNNFVLDPGDSQFNYFGVLDANGDFTLLSSLGIRAISLISDDQPMFDGNNYIHGHSQYFHWGSQTPHLAADIAFEIGEQSQNEPLQLNNIIPNSHYIFEHTDLGNTAYKAPQIIHQPASLGALGGEIIGIKQSTFVPGSTISSPVDGLTILSTPEGNRLYFFTKDLVLEEFDTLNILPSWHSDALFNEHEIGNHSVYFSQQVDCECACYSENPSDNGGGLLGRDENGMGGLQFQAGDMFYFYNTPFAIDTTPYRFIDGLRYINIDYTYSIESIDGQVNTGSIELLIQDDAPNVMDLSILVSLLDDQYFGDYLGASCDPSSNHFGSNGGMITNVTALNASSILNGDDFSITDAYNNTLVLNRLNGEFVYNINNPLFDQSNNPLTSEFMVEVTDNHGNIASSALSFTGANFEFLPLVLDLDGNGLDLVNAYDSNVSSIMDNGIHHRIGWIDEGSGILAYDPLQTGEVTSRQQIQFSSYREGARTDIEGLLAFDSNQNKQLDFGDHEFNAFGVLDAHGEFQTLIELGIQSISLISDQKASGMVGNHIYGYTEYLKVDGTSHVAADVALFVGEQGFGETLQLSDVMPENDNIINDPHSIDDSLISNTSTFDSPELTVPFQSELAVGEELILTIP